VQARHHVLGQSQALGQIGEIELVDPAALVHGEQRLDAILDADLGAYAYVASLLAVDQRRRVNQLYLAVGAEVGVEDRVEEIAERQRRGERLVEALALGLRGRWRSAISSTRSSTPTSAPTRTSPRCSPWTSAAGWLTRRRWSTASSEATYA
jgi:hypothetical protein